MRDPRHDSDLDDIPAFHDDITRILGPQDDVTAMAILILRPTICDLEAASLWMMGDDDLDPCDVLPRSSVVAWIVAILTADEADARLVDVASRSHLIH